MACGMRPQPDVTVAQRLLQSPQVALERIELEYQARRVDFGEQHAGCSGGTESHRGLRLSVRAAAKRLASRLSENPLGAPFAPKVLTLKDAGEVRCPLYSPTRAQ